MAHSENGGLNVFVASVHVSSAWSVFNNYVNRLRSMQVLHQTHVTPDVVYLVRIGTPQDSHSGLKFDFVNGKLKPTEAHFLKT
jgi:hypothetical protein